MTVTNIEVASEGKGPVDQNQRPDRRKSPQVATDSAPVTILPGVAPAQKSGHASRNQQQQKRNRRFVKKGSRKKRGEPRVTPFTVEECWAKQHVLIHGSFAGEHETVKVSLGQEAMVAGEGNHVFESRAIAQACLPLCVPNFACWFHSRKGRKTKRIS